MDPNRIVRMYPNSSFMWYNSEAENIGKNL